MRAALLGLLISTSALARPVHQFEEIALSPDATVVASVEGDEAAGGAVDIRSLVLRNVATGASTDVHLPCGRAPECTPTGLAWAPDGTRLVFALRSPGTHDYALLAVGPTGGPLRKLLEFKGTLAHPRFNAAGQLAVLATEGAEKEQGAVEAGAPVGGELGGPAHEQRIAVVHPDGSLGWASPADLFVYEYDWVPDGTGFVGTAAPGDGDNNWWTARLLRFDATGGRATLLHAPTTARQQIASPVVSPDGRQVAFIGGLMSDFGATGGDVFVMKLAGGAPENITASRHATTTALAWTCDGGGLVVSELAGGTRRLVELRGDRQAPPAAVFEGAVSLTGTDAPYAPACRAGQSAVVRQDFTRPPEIAVGAPGQWRDVTHANLGLTAPAVARDLAWQSGGHRVQGWLLLPVDSHLGEKLPLITEVHGGPAWASQPEFAGSGLREKLLSAGYAVFLPNPRGSFGQGEAFQEANVRDFGRGDLADILAGITAAEAVAPIDEHRLGLTGWSYGGFMTMFAVTQTTRFAAAVAGAGIANWQSYYGENGIDGWMIPFFGASVYDDPAVYARASAITYIKKVRTPTLAVVGERDIECPAPQTMEFWHALHALGRETAAVIYPGEGHAMHRPEHVADFETRTLAWFDRHLRGR